MKKRPGETYADVLAKKKMVEKAVRESVHDHSIAIEEIIDLLMDVSTVEVYHGRWREKILVGGFAEEWGYVCSECGCTVSDRSNLSFGRFARINQRLNYCPNCGADMRERKDNER
jgi:rubrerythrin